MTPVETTVPTLTIVIFAINILLGIAFPVALFIFFRKKYHLRSIPFIAGAGTFIVFAVILESILHSLVLNTPAGDAIVNNIFLYALYGGLAAGVFEETGRFVVMKLLLKKYYGDDHNSLMFGAGHGGIEALAILVTGFINNLLYAVTINSGFENTLFESIPEGMEDAADQIRTMLEALKTTNPLIYLISPLERIPAIVLHISLSVIVWFAVTCKGKGWLYPFAILIHALADGITVIISGLTGSKIIPEIFIFICCAAVTYLTYRLWKANAVPAVKTAETADTAAGPEAVADNTNEQGESL